ncbi:uroporphyrinogen-III synthase [Palleronia abyssalis]|uniref:Tetrapyrrole biosynthesis uroporphyrinogen III synthase domain-containing protein n=1 Tax=Palleronia abyssalis TaxID=1501240 RepID=A0A2R8BSR5_9RHOB|nr:uroporphyrinogen-III synthase [Palleronia abyssalis]SPJ23209.1 hypothetical protein PAA8504_01014 [Palleronia abyssalis]
MLILTRPLPAARRTAVASRQRGVGGAILFSPVLRILPRKMVGLPPGTPIFTSENGVRAVADQVDLSGRPVIAVGPRTAAVAASYGALPEITGGQADALATALIARGGGEYVHLHGAHVTGDLVGRLQDAGIAAQAEMVYDQQQLPLTGAARHALLGSIPVILPLYSPRSARIVASDLGEKPVNTRVIALSQQVAQSWPWTDTALVATTTEGPAMLDAIAAAVAAQN